MTKVLPGLCTSQKLLPTDHILSCLGVKIYYSYYLLFFYYKLFLLFLFMEIYTTRAYLPQTTTNTFGRFLKSKWKLTSTNLPPERNRQKVASRKWWEHLYPKYKTKKKIETIIDIMCQLKLGVYLNFLDDTQICRLCRVLTARLCWFVGFVF